LTTRTAPTIPIHTSFPTLKKQTKTIPKPKQGVYNIFAKLRDSILAEVARLRPRHVFVTGHSLGGALTHLMSHAVASRFPKTTVDGVAFASIMVGDETFMRELQVREEKRSAARLLSLGVSRLWGVSKARMHTMNHRKTKPTTGHCEHARRHVSRPREGKGFFWLPSFPPSYAFILF